MTDPLFARAQRAIEESQALQDQSHALQSEQVRERGELRRSVMESAMYRSEVRAHRHNRE